MKEALIAMGIGAGCALTFFLLTLGALEVVRVLRPSGPAKPLGVKLDGPHSKKGRRR